MSQSLVYACIGMDEAIMSSPHKGYEIADGCPGGMLETTYWMEDIALPVLLTRAEALGYEPLGCEWLYDVCQGYGHAIILAALTTSVWPLEDELPSLADGVIESVQ